MLTSVPDCVLSEYLEPYFGFADIEAVPIIKFQCYLLVVLAVQRKESRAGMVTQQIFDQREHKRILLDYSDTQYSYTWRVVSQGSSTD